MSSNGQVKWTSDQKKAIDSRGKGIVVSAAAGSGKTAVLIERMIRLLSDEHNKIPADRLLAVTFTKEAAAQMKDKLNEAFSEQLRRDPENKWLLSQQNLLQLANISTINAFCLDLVKSNLHKFDFQGGITILDDSIQTLILQESKKAALEKLCSEDYESYEFLRRAFRDSALDSILTEFYTFMRSLAFPNKWVEQAHRNFTDDEIFDGLISDNFTKMSDKLDKAYQLYYRFEHITQYSDDLFIFSDYDKLYLTAESDRELLHNVKKAIENKDIDYFAENTANFERIKPAPRDKRFNELADDIKLRINDLHVQAASYRSDYKNIVNEIFGFFKLSRDKLKENMLLSDRIFSILCDLCRDIEAFSMKEKVERNGVTFSDVELMARDLLIEETETGVRRTELAEEIRNNRLYEIIFIDEFQDVNNLQELVFRALSDTDNPEIMGKNVFVVGDIKQAIYRFRLSNPELFSKTRRDALDEKNSDTLESITLSKNFRSRRTVIDFVNFLFHILMTEKNGQVNYDSSEELQQGAEFVGEDIPTEVMLIQGDKEYGKIKGYSVENYIVASKIREMIDQKVQVCEHGKLRDCRAGDFCILVQVNKECSRVAKALESVGLKAHSEDTDGYMKSREISIVVNLLRIIDNPMNDIALTAVMMSPVMDFSPDDMAKISQRTKISGTRLRDHIYQVLAAAGAEKGERHEKEAEYIDLGDSLLQQKCSDACKLINSLRYFSMSMGLERLIRKIYDMTDLMGITSLYLDSAKKRANLRLLLEYAASYEENSQEGVTGFLRYLDSVSANEKAFKQAVTVTEGADSVSVKTYHASKGLEFPFVFLCQLDHSMTGMKRNFCTHNELGFAFAFNDNDRLLNKSSLYYNYLSDISALEEKSERLRLLYVGCTRAKEKLFVCCAPNAGGTKSYENVINDKIKYISRLRNNSEIEGIVSDASTMLDWIMLALSLHKDGETLLEWLGTDKIGIEESDYPMPEIEFDEYHIEEKQQETEENKHIKAKPNNALLKTLTDKFNYEYDNSDCETPAKMTVTEITEIEKEKKLGEKNPEFYPNLPRLDDELDKLTSAEKGTFTHKFMELADYEKAKADVKCELDRLVEKGFFSRKEADGVYIDAVEAFFSSDFYKRMSRSPQIMREKKFLVSISDLDLKDRLPDYEGKGGMIQGIADCIFKENDEYVLVDYKTDRFKDIEQVMEYKTQLELYKAAFELILGEKIKSSYIYSFWLRKGVEIPL